MVSPWRDVITCRVSNAPDALTVTYKQTNRLQTSAMSTTTLIAVTAVSIALVYYVVIPFSLRLVGSELRRRTIGVRQKLLDDSGVEESTKGRLVGFFHPYW